jgi:Flp pilus assembly protein TadD
MNGWQAVAATLCVITGTVYDAQHHPAAAAKVYLQAADQKEVMVLTDAHGMYRFSTAAGTYTLRALGTSLKITAEPDKTTTADLSPEPAFFDEPSYTAAGVTDYTYRGGHGSDTVFRSSTTLAKALQDEPARADDPKEAVLYREGTDLLNNRKAQAAAETFIRGVRLFPKSVRMLLGMASACYMEGSYDEAAQWFYKATDLVATDPKPYFFLAKVRAKQITESSGYKERMAQLVKLQPDSALANYYYGATLADEQARDSLQKAVRLDDHLAPAYVRLGVIAAHEGNYREAIREYQSAIAAEPALEEAHYRMSEAYRLMGDSAKAKEELVIFERLSKESAARQ